MGIGILAHCFGKLPYNDLAKTIGDSGFNYIQLALAKAFSDVDSGLGKLSPGLAHTIRDTFQGNGVRIASLGCYINTIQPNLPERRAEIDRFKEHLRLARDFGTSIVATETGKPAHHDDKEEAWSTMLETVSELAEEASRWGVIVGIEPAWGHIIDSVESMTRLLKEVPSPHISVVFDPCNLMHVGNVGQQEEVMNQAFEAFGDRIVLVHAKDFDFSGEGNALTYKPLGDGLLNYEHFINLVQTHKPLIDITLEGIQMSEIRSSLVFIQSCIHSR